MQLREALARTVVPELFDELRFAPRLEPLLAVRSRTDLAFPLDPGIVSPASEETWATLCAIGICRRATSSSEAARCLYVRLSSGEPFPTLDALPRISDGALVLVEVSRQPSVFDIGPTGARLLAELIGALPQGAMPDSARLALQKQLGPSTRTATKPVALPRGLRLLDTIPFGGLAAMTIAPAIHRPGFERDDDYFDSISAVLGFDAAMRRCGVWQPLGSLQLAVRESTHS